MSRPRPRPAAGRVTAALAAAVVIAVAGCGDGDREDPAGPSADPTPGTPAQAGLEPTPALFPATAQEYAEAAVTAWATPDLVRLADLTTPDVHQQILELPGPPDLRWTTAGCDQPEPDEGPGEAEPAAGWACAFHNTDGDHLVLTVAPELLAGPRAVVAVEFDGTVFPEQAEDYVAEFVAAWQSGNQPRMDRLALADATAAFARLPVTAEVSYQPGVAEERVVTVVVVLDLPETAATAAPDGTEPTVEVEARLSVALLGEPRAIRQAVPTDPS